MTELFKALISWGKQHKGFAGFAAFLIVVLLAALFIWLSSSNPSLLLATAGYIIIAAVFILLVLLIVMVFVRSAPPAQATIYVTVHEEGAPTRLIEGAKVTLLLPVPVSLMTQANGSAVFLIQNPAWIGKIVPIGVEKIGFASSDPQKIKIVNGRQIVLKLTPLQFATEPPMPPGGEPELSGRSVTFSGSAAGNFVVTGDHNKINQPPEEE